MQTILEHFFALTPDRVLDCSEHFGARATGYVLPLNSLENRVFEIAFEDDTKKVVKFYRPGRWSKAAILEEHTFIAELNEAEVPVVMPVMLEEGSTLGTLTVDEGILYYALFPKVYGRVPQELKDDELELIGHLLARLHTVGASRTAEHRPTLSARSYGTDSLIRLRESGLVPADCGDYFTVAERLVARADGWLTDLKTLRTHGDCHLGNLLLDGQGRPFFIDFDDFLHAPAAQDLWLLVPGRDEESIAQRSILVEAYGEMRSFDLRELKGIEALRSLRIIRYAAWVAQRYADPAFKRAFPDFASSQNWQRERNVLAEQLEQLEKEIVQT